MSTAQPVVLVIEDEVDLASLVEVNLDLAGYDVLVENDGESGLAAIGEHRPDLVLLDVMLPGLDGWGVLRAAKADDSTSDVPIVMLTALSEERDLIRGHLQGAVEYVTKPFEMRRLLRAVEEALREPTPEERDEQRARTRSMLQRLAELDSGRAGTPQQVRLSALERPPEPTPEPTATPEQRAGLATLTPKQRWLAAALGAGWSAKEIADHLEVSRSNVYATRRRVARRLGCDADAVAECAIALGITGEVGAPGE